MVNIEPKYPASDSPEDLAATRRAEAYMNRQYLDPAFFGTIRRNCASIFGEAWPEWPQEDMDSDQAAAGFHRRQLLHPQRIQAR